MIPLSFLFFIVGIYGRVFADFFNDLEKKDKKNIVKINHYIDFFEYQKKLNDTDDPLIYDTIKCNISNESQVYKHLVILDRTMSTKSEKYIESESIISKKEQLAINLNTYFKGALGSDSDSYSEIDHNSTSLKELVTMNIFKKVYEIGCKKNNIETLNYVTYDGNQKDDDAIKKFNEKTFEWISDSLILQTLIKEKDSLYYRMSKQVTDFTTIFDTIQKLQDPTTIVTIISDFYHEQEIISGKVIEKYLQGINRAYQYNLVYIVPESESILEKSNDLVKLWIEKMHGTSQYIVDINSSDISNLLESIEIDLVQCFSPIHTNKDDSIKPLTFYYPRTKGLYNTAKCKMIPDCTISNDTTHNNIFHWKIINPYDYFDNEFYFFERKDESKSISKSSVKINSKEWREFCLHDTLILEFPLSSKIYSSQYHLSVIHNEENFRYKMVFKEYIPYSIARISLFLVYCVLILTFFLFF